MIRVSDSELLEGGLLRLVFFVSNCRILSGERDLIDQRSGHLLLSCPDLVSSLYSRGMLLLFVPSTIIHNPCTSIEGDGREPLSSKIHTSQYGKP